jgi:hypothetical protein
MTIRELAEALRFDRSATVDGVSLTLLHELALAAADTLSQARPSEETVLAIVGATHTWYLATSSHVLKVSVEALSSSPTPHNVTVISWPRRALTSLQVTTRYTSQVQGATGLAVFLKSVEMTCEGVPLTLKGEHPPSSERPEPQHVLQFARVLTE